MVFFVLICEFTFIYLHIAKTFALIFFIFLFPGGGGLDIPLNRLDDAGFRDHMSPPRVTFDER